MATKLSNITESLFISFLEHFTNRDKRKASQQEAFQKTEPVIFLARVLLSETVHQYIEANAPKCQEQ